MQLIFSAYAIQRSGIMIYSNLENLVFYMVEPVDEYFLHFMLWKNVPFTFTLDENTENVDVTLTTVVEKRNAETANQKCFRM